jgi:hypothetical protein
MQLARLHNRPKLNPVPGYHGTNVLTESVDWDNHGSVCQHFQPYVRLDMKDVCVVNETTYKDLAQLVDGNFLRQQMRAEELTDVRFVGFEPEDIMNFHINSSNHTKNRIVYTNSFQFEQWEEVGVDPDFNFNEKARLLLWAGNVKLHCSCPSFLYWGYQYMLTVMDAAIYPEERFPRIRNPTEKGIVCKHLNRALRVLPFHNGKIASELKSQFG